MAVNTPKTDDLAARFAAFRLRGQVAEAVKLVREECGPWSQREFAEKLGVTAATVNRWETGKHEPLARYIRAMESIIAGDEPA